jgi:hypothetical protein
MKACRGVDVLIQVSLTSPVVQNGYMGMLHNLYGFIEIHGALHIHNFSFKETPFGATRYIYRRLDMKHVEEK